MVNILTAIYSKTSGSTLSSLVGGRIYEGRAPQDAAFPYVVFFIPTGIPDDAFKQKGWDLTIQFSIFTVSHTTPDAPTIYNALHSLYDDCSLSIVGHTAIWMHETNLATMTDDIATLPGEAEVDHWAADYELITEVS